MGKYSFEQDFDIVKELTQIFGSALTEVGNSKKMNCRNFHHDLCSRWSWTYKPSFPFQMDEPRSTGNEWNINPNPMFCAICHRFRDRSG